MSTPREISEYFAKFGRQGGRIRASRLTSAQRSASARRAAQARWKKTVELVAWINVESEKLLANALKNERKAKRKTRSRTAAKKGRSR